jgi:hypothetical protein
LLAAGDVDGALVVGGASLKADEFWLSPRQPKKGLEAPAKWTR